MKTYSPRIYGSRVEMEETYEGSPFGDWVRREDAERLEQRIKELESK